MYMRELCVRCPLGSDLSPQKTPREARSLPLRRGKTYPVHRTVVYTYLLRIPLGKAKGGEYRYIFSNFLRAPALVTKHAYQLLVSHSTVWGGKRPIQISELDQQYFRIASWKGRRLREECKSNIMKKRPARFEMY